MSHLRAKRIAKNLGIDIIADMGVKIAIGAFSAAEGPMKIERKRPAGLIEDH